MLSNLERAKEELRGLLETTERNCPQQEGSFGFEDEVRSTILSVLELLESLKDANLGEQCLTTETANKGEIEPCHRI